MTDGVRVNLEAAQAIRSLEKFGDRIRRSGMRRAFRAAAKEAAAATRATNLFSDKTGKLRASIGVKQVKGTVRLVADAPHAHLVERGHGGPHPAKAHPFIEGGVHSSRERQLEAGAKALAAEARKAHKGKRSNRRT